MIKNEKNKILLLLIIFIRTLIIIIVVRIRRTIIVTMNKSDILRRAVTHHDDDCIVVATHPDDSLRRETGSYSRHLPPNPDKVLNQWLILHSCTILLFPWHHIPYNYTLCLLSNSPAFPVSLLVVFRQTSSPSSTF